MTGAEKGAGTAASKRLILSWRVAGPLVVVLLAFWVLHRLAAEVRWVDVTASIAAAGITVLLAICAVSVSLVARVGQDILAGPVAGFAGVAGFAIFSLTGAAVRPSAKLAKIAGVRATVRSGFWLGLMLVTGAVLVADPVGADPVGLTAMLPMSGRSGWGWGRSCCWRSEGPSSGRGKDGSGVWRACALRCRPAGLRRDWLRLPSLT